MTRLSTSLRFTFALLGIALLVACAPGDQAPSAEEIANQIATGVALTVEAQGQIATSVAQTVEAQQTEAAGALPTPTLTATGPAPTLTPILPTATPFVIAPSSGGGGGGGGGTSPGADFSCDVMAKPYPDWSEFPRNGTFDIKWTIINNGTQTWVAGKDLTYLSGPNLTNPNSTLVQLPEVKPGNSTVVIFDAKAPTERGKQVMTWKLEGGFCYPYTAIIVK